MTISSINVTKTERFLAENKSKTLHCFCFQKLSVDIENTDTSTKMLSNEYH